VKTTPTGNSTLFSGNRPKVGEQIAIVGQFAVYRLPSGSYPWCPIKVIAMPGIQLHKANFRLGWSVEGRRFAKTADAARMAEDHPQVWNALHSACADLIDPASIPRKKMNGEFRAELERLRGDIAAMLERVDTLLGGEK
jgi:hypothetical protein